MRGYCAAMGSLARPNGTFYLACAWRDRLIKAADGPSLPAPGSEADRASFRWHTAFFDWHQKLRLSFPFRQGFAHIR